MTATAMQIPLVYRVVEVHPLTDDVFSLVLAPPPGTATPSFAPGQFNMLYQYGCGEVAISICGDPLGDGLLCHTIRAVGSVTKSMRSLRVGDSVGVRGPFGTRWPLDREGGDVMVIAGGIGLAALHAALMMLARHRERYGRVTLLYGARTVDDLLYYEDVEAWRRRGIEVVVTLDVADERWQGNVGVVTALINRYLYDPAATLVMMCGPEIMMHYALHELMGASVDKANVYLSLERNMQCATAFCGHCQYGPFFVCKDGPVFAYRQIDKFMTIKEL